MKNFAYAAPRTESDLLDVLQQSDGATQFLAGGTDLVGLMKSMVERPDLVINIMDMQSLRGVEPDVDGGVVIGAATTLDEVAESPHLAMFPSIQQVIDGIDSMQLRAQGTFGGELCRRPRCWYFRNGHGLLANQGRTVQQGDHRYHAIMGNQGPAQFVSASRLAPTLIALNAAVRVVGPGLEAGSWLPLVNLYRAPRHDGQRELTLAPGQLLTHVMLPAPQDWLHAAYEVRQGYGPEAPLAAAAAALRHNGGVVQEARIVMGQVAPTPWLAAAAARSLEGMIVDVAAAERAGEIAVADATPLEGNVYKISLARVAVKRAILRAAGLETGGF